MMCDNFYHMLEKKTWSYAGFEKSATASYLKSDMIQ